MLNFVKQGWAVAVLMIGLLVVQGCASLPGSGATPEQQYYEVKAQWNTLMTVVVSWANTSAGQSFPDVLIQIQAVSYRVSGVLQEIEIAMCYQGAATAFDPAPLPLPECIPLDGSVASQRFAFAAQLIAVAISEVRRTMPSGALTGSGS